RLPSDPTKRKLSVHWPTSESTIAPGRTPGQVPVPNGAAAGTGSKVHGTPPSVQLAEEDDPRSSSPACTGTAPASRVMNAAGIAKVFLANILPSCRNRYGNNECLKCHSEPGVIVPLNLGR